MQISLTFEMHTAYHLIVAENLVGPFLLPLFYVNLLFKDPLPSIRMKIHLYALTWNKLASEFSVLPITTVLVFLHHSAHIVHRPNPLNATLK